MNLCTKPLRLSGVRLQENTVAKQLLLKDSRERWAYPTLSLSVTELKEIQL